MPGRHTQRLDLDSRQRPVRVDTLIVTYCIAYCGILRVQGECVLGQGGGESGCGVQFRVEGLVLIDWD